MSIRNLGLKTSAIPYLQDNGSLGNTQLESLALRLGHIVPSTLLSQLSDQDLALGLS